MFPPEIQYIISNYQIFGFIPLDKVLHFIVGMILTIGLRIFGVKITPTLIIVLTVAVIKEIIDSFVLNNSYEEHFLDILITLVYPLLLMAAIKIESKDKA